MEVDATTYFAAVDDARDPPPVMSREEAVLLALINDEHIPGLCAACRIPTERAEWCRWCEDCAEVAYRFAQIARTGRRDNGLKAADNCIDCGKKYPSRFGPSRRCVPCQGRHDRKAKTDSQRRRRARQREAARRIRSDCRPTQQGGLV